MLLHASASGIMELGGIYPCPTFQAAFYVGYAKDLWNGFPNCLAHWYTIMVCGVKWHKTT